MDRKTAIVISGGGAKGAWAVGVLRHLMKEKQPPEMYDVAIGTSTGALIAPMAALGEIDELVRVYTHVRDRDILGFRVSKNVYLNAIWGLMTGRDSFFSTSPLRRTLETFLTEEHWSRLRSGEAEAWVSVVNLQTSAIEYYGSHQEGMTREKFLAAMLASASIPVFMSRGRIPGEADETGRPYWFVDGGVKDLLPLGQAVRVGAREITAIMLGPEPSPVKRKFRWLPRILHRVIDLQGQETGENDINIGQLITRELGWRDRLHRNLCAVVDRSVVDKAFATTSSEDEPMQTEDGRRYVAVQFRMIRPAKSLGETLAFGPKRMAAYEEAGYQFAQDPANWKTIP